MESSRQSPNHPTERARMAEKVAAEVVKADAAIMSLMVLDVGDGGKVLAVARSPTMAPHEHATPAMVQKFAIAAVVVWGAARQAAELMGRREFIVGAFSEQLVLLADLKEFDMLLAIRLNRSSNAEHVYSKVASLLGLH